jgi:DNA ligase-1
MSMRLPTLYKLTSTGKIQTWKIDVSPILNDDWERGLILTTYGLLDGKTQTASEVVSEGKNIGKANETTPYEQAEAEAQSQWEKKIKKGYVQNIEDAQGKKIDTNFITGGIEPMLAQSYDKHSAKIKYPAYVQPKLDGHRCIAIIQDGKCTLWSRTRKPITGVPHIARELERILGNVPGIFVFDGELYNHDYREKFEELTSYIRQVTPKPGHEVVQYVIYDLVNDAPYSERRIQLEDYALQLNGTHLAVLPAFPVDDEEAMITLFGVFLEQGYEGLMVRNSAGIYKNKRSYDLQKVKVMADAEFEVTDVTEGRGKMAGKAMFHCKTADGGEFRVKMVGALDSLNHYLDHKEDYIGKMLTVKYQNLSAEGIPRFPIALRFRSEL